ncbi:MAG: tRNA (guanosine(37)-N1)-methyltransferase TrmD [Lachnospiraceae bacterium]|nr:tRNA (guanosine(37)-N1)-methyltransferase TrmD [Lachnospiraceae bacterium]
MRFSVMTLFPEMIESSMNSSITGRALENNLIKLDVYNIRDYSLDKHKKVDDYTYGGGAGMLMFPQPIYDCYKAIESRITGGDEGGKKPRVIYLSPKGRIFNQAMAKELSLEEDLVFLCGHYEGVDQRVLDEIVTDEVSIGDYVLTGGELPALVMMDTISRLVPGVLNNEESSEDESHSAGLLEYPQYTRPAEWMGKKVPDVLVSGNHALIAKWRMEQSLEVTKKNRPDMYEKYINSQQG